MKNKSLIINVLYSCPHFVHTVFLEICSEHTHICGEISDCRHQFIIPIHNFNPPFFSMKKSIILLLAVAYCMQSICVNVAIAQAPSFTLADFPFVGVTKSTDYGFASGGTAPTKPNGSPTAQTWNYTTLTPANNYTFDYIALTSPLLATLTHVETGLVDPIAGRIVDFNNLWGLGADGWGIIGRNYPAQRYGIGDLTGNPLDSFNLEEQYSIFPSKMKLMPFPMTQGTTNGSNFLRSYTASLTLTNYGIINTPFEKRSREIRKDTVVGWGTITTKLPTGNSVPYPCLLVNRHIRIVDSFYLGGQPAPAVLLQAFGLAQNTIYEISRKTFWRAGELFPAFSITYSDKNFGVYSEYSVNRSGMVVSTENRSQNVAQVLQVFPNPSSTGQTFIVPTKNEAMQVMVTDITGKIVLSTSLAANDSPVQIPLPDHLAKGIYALRVTYLSSQTTESNKLIID